MRWLAHVTRHTSHVTRHTSPDVRRISPAVIDAQRFIELRVAAAALVEGGNEAVQLLRLRVCAPDLRAVMTTMMTVTMMVMMMMMVMMVMMAMMVMMVMIVMMMMMMMNWTKVTVAQPQMKSYPPNTERKSCDLYQERTCMPCMRLRHSG
jgi:hypothetical protein